MTPTSLGEFSLAFAASGHLCIGRRGTLNQIT
jgi:hypothetical protein